MFELRWDLGLGEIKPKVKVTARKCLVLTISILVELPKMMLLQVLLFMSCIHSCVSLLDVQKYLNSQQHRVKCLGLALCIKMLEDQKNIQPISEGRFFPACQYLVLSAVPLEAQPWSIVLSSRTRSIHVKKHWALQLSCLIPWHFYSVGTVLGPSCVKS